MTQWINEILSQFQKDSWLAWSMALVISLILSIGLKMLFKFLIPQVQDLTHRTHAWWDDLIVEFLQSFKFWVVFIIVMNASIHVINSNKGINEVSHSLMVIAIAWQIGNWVIIAFKIWKNKFISKKLQVNQSSSAALNLLFSAIQALIIVVIILIALSNIGVDISAVIASLGIGGIAIALALQNILSDLFGSVTIVLDKPFVVGDYITVGVDSGTVEHIGIKTTRVRAVTGEELVFANKDLLENRIHNYKRMFKRRVEKRVTVLREKTELSKIKEINAWVENYLKNNDKVDLEYCRLISVDNTYIDFEVVFHLVEPSFKHFVDMQQNFILSLMEEFKNEEISITNKGETRVITSSFGVITK